MRGQGNLPAPPHNSHGHAVFQGESFQPWDTPSVCERAGSALSDHPQFVVQTPIAMDGSLFTRGGDVCVFVCVCVSFLGCCCSGRSRFGVSSQGVGFLTWRRENGGRKRVGMLWSVMISHGERACTGCFIKRKTKRRRRSSRSWDDPAQQEPQNYTKSPGGGVTIYLAAAQPMLPITFPLFLGADP